MQGRLALLVALLASAAFAGCTASAERLDRADLADAPAPGPIAPGWAAREAATIRPGMPLVTEFGECPTNFVFVRPDNTSVFIGTTAACVRDLHVGSLATIGGELNLAVLVYSSWITMAENGETDRDALEYNDFAVFRIDSSARRHVHPELPVAGGPSATADESSYAVGARLRTYVPNGTLVGWREGVVAGEVGDWGLVAYHVVPGAPSSVEPGAMGGAVLDADGRAVGLMVTLGVVPHPGANGVARLDTVMAYAKVHAKLDMLLVTSAYVPPPAASAVVGALGDLPLAKPESF